MESAAKGLPSFSVTVLHDHNTLLDSISKPNLPVVEQVFRPEYSRLADENLEFGDVPHTDRMSDLASAWKLLGKKTKERILFAQYLRLLQEVDNKKAKNIVGDLFWLLRCCFAENNLINLGRMFEGLRMFSDDMEQGKTWFKDIGGDAFLRSLSDATGASTYKTLYQHLLDECYGLVKLVKIIWKFTTKNSNTDRLVRKLDACKILLTANNYRQIKQFMGDSSTDTYLKHLRDIYPDSWSRLLLGTVNKCAACGNSTYKMWTCGLCVQAHTKNKTRYCNRKCQQIDWKRHRHQHESGFDRELHDDTFERLTFFCMVGLE